MKPDIALNLGLANIPVTVCLIRYPLFSEKQKYVIKSIYVEVEMFKSIKYLCNL